MPEPTATPHPLSNAPAAPAPGPAATPRKLRNAVPADKRGWWWGTGRRKTAVARVRMKLAKDGGATFVVNSPSREAVPVEKYFNEERDRSDAVAPLKLTNTLEKFSV